MAEYLPKALATANIYSFIHVFSMNIFSLLCLSHYENFWRNNIIPTLKALALMDIYVYVCVTYLNLVNKEIQFYRG